MFAKKVSSSMEQSAVLKSITKMMGSKDNKDLNAKYRDLLSPHKVIVRLYVLKGKSLTPADETGNSDPFLIIRLGNTVIKDMESLRNDTNNPAFFRQYDIPTELPG